MSATSVGATTITATSMQVGTIRMPAGAAPASPADGDLWYDSTRKARIDHLAGINIVRGGTLFVATANGVASTTSDGSLIGTGIGTTTLPANFLVPGRTIRITVRGSMATALGAGAAVKVKLGSTTVGSVGGLSLSLLSNVGIEIRAEITCRTAGAAGTVMCSGHLLYGGNSAIIQSGTPTTAITIDTTAAQTIDVTAAWLALSSSMTGTIATIETVN